MHPSSPAGCEMECIIHTSMTTIRTATDHWLRRLYSCWNVWIAWNLRLLCQQQLLTNLPIGTQVFTKSQCSTHCWDSEADIWGCIQVKPAVEYWQHDHNQECNASQRYYSLWRSTKQVSSYTQCQLYTCTARLRIQSCCKCTLNCIHAATHN